MARLLRHGPGDRAVQRRRFTPSGWWFPEGRLRSPLFEDMHPTGGSEPDDLGQSHCRPLDLTLTGLTPEVMADLPDIGDAGSGNGVALGLETTGDVDGRSTVTERRTRLEEVDGTPGRTEHQVVVVDQLGGGKAVVELDQVEVLGADSRLLVSLLGGIPGQGVHVGQDLARLFPGIGGED